LVFLRTPGKRWWSISNWALTASFHIGSNSLFTNYPVLRWDITNNLFRWKRR
jgi:hypothetical protein